MTKQKDQKIVQLCETFSRDERDQLDAFRVRFKELWKNFEDLRKSGLNLSGGFDLGSNGVVNSDVVLGVSRFRIKGFLVDYRHFHGREPSNFFAVINTVKRRCRDAEIHAYLEEAKSSWTESGALSGWHNHFTIEEVVEAVFKENVFHTVPTGKANRVRLEDVEAKLSSSAVWFEITHMAYRRTLVVRNLNWILDPIFSGTDGLRLPTT